MAVDVVSHLASLRSGLAERFDSEGRAGGVLAAQRLRESLNAPYRPTAASHDPGPLLSAACALPDALPLSSHVLGCRSLLQWSLWEGEGLDRNISSSLFSTELVGPDGHFAGDDVRVGLLLSDAGTDYPRSSHSGEETYLVLAGTAEWTVGDEPYTAKPPGALVHHPAWAVHGRRTLGEPFLGAWRWSGDLDLSSFSVAEPG